MAYIKKADRPDAPFSWTEKNIGRAIQKLVFNGRYLCMVPNCSWTGDECDMLVVTEDLRIIDIEIKISTSDLKADARKDKWFYRWEAAIDGMHTFGKPEARRPRDWPQKVWKHYYAVPRDIWKDALKESLPSDKSGVIVFYERGGKVHADIIQPATPCREADRLSPANVMHIARLANIRMWEAYHAIGR